MLCIYNIIHVSFFPTHVPGRLGSILCVYVRVPCVNLYHVKIVSTSISYCAGVRHVHFYILSRALYTALSFSLICVCIMFVYTCILHSICVHAILCVVRDCVVACTFARVFHIVANYMYIIQLSLGVSLSSCARARASPAPYNLNTQRGCRGTPRAIRLIRGGVFNNKSHGEA